MIAEIGGVGKRLRAAFAELGPNDSLPVSCPSGACRQAAMVVVFGRRRAARNAASSGGASVDTPVNLTCGVRMLEAGGDGRLCRGIRRAWRHLLKRGFQSFASRGRAWRFNHRRAIQMGLGTDSRVTPTLGWRLGMGLASALGLFGVLCHVVPNLRDFRLRLPWDFAELT